jgi:PleD family two-component response regulator
MTLAVAAYLTLIDYYLERNDNDAHGVVTASLGVAPRPVSTISAADIITAADAGLYVAKRSERNRTLVAA